MKEDKKRPRITKEVWLEFKILAIKNETTAEYEIEKVLEDFLNQRKSK